MTIHKININIDDLTEDQRMVYNSEIKLGENISVQGGPGTGKTLLLFLIAEKIKNAGRDYRIITNQNNLKNFLKYSFENIDNKKILNAWGANDTKTFPEKIGIMYEIAKSINNPFPKNFFTKEKTTNDKRNFLRQLYNSIKKDGSRLKDIYKDKFILVDEAQDLPTEYFQILNEVFGSVFIFGDNNQKINDDFDDEMNKIVDILGIKINKKFYLNINFRNSKQIYNFAKLTQIKDKDIEVINEGSTVKIIKGANESQEIKKIKDIINENIGGNVAIISNKPKNYYTKEINNIYKGAYINLETDNIFCLNFKNNKGLEFDVVIITGFQKRDFFTKDMYVAITRTGYNKITRNGWKLYIFSNEIENYIENNKDYEIIDMGIESEEAHIEELLF